MGGYQASFQFNLTVMLQTQGDHIAACIDYVRRNGHDTIDVDAGDRGVVGAGSHRASRQDQPQPECTPGYYNFEGEFNRRQDGNYNGGFPQYFEHMARPRRHGRPLHVHLTGRRAGLCQCLPRWAPAGQLRRDGVDRSNCASACPNGRPGDELPRQPVAGQNRPVIESSSASPRK